MLLTLMVGVLHLKFAQAYSDSATPSDSADVPEWEEALSELSMSFDAKLQARDDLIFALQDALQDERERSDALQHQIDMINDVDLMRLKDLPQRVSNLEATDGV